jgi:hypothetical protein
VGILSARKKDYVLQTDRHAGWTSMMAKSGTLGGPGRNAGAPPAPFLKAVDRLAEPLVRALISLGVTFPLFTQLLKRVYIRVATKQAQTAGAPLTVSRISVMTGLQRKDIGQIKEQIARKQEPTATISLGSRLIGIWNGAKEFTDSSGRPLPLPRYSGPSPTFEDLVRSVSTDVRPRAVLDEWLRLGVVKIDEQDRVHMRSDWFVPRQGFEELSYFYGRNLADHIAASTYNLLGEGEPRLERAVYYDKLTPDSVATLEEYARKVGGEALRQINREALRLADADEGKLGADQRMSIGMYYYSGPDEGTEDDGEMGNNEN